MKMSKEIPLYTRIGTKITTILLVLLGFMIIKNCAGSIYYGLSTDSDTQEHYYNLGRANGGREARGMKQTPAPAFDNPVLEKAYNKGFQVGWDSSHKDEMQDVKSAADIGGSR